LVKQNLSNFSILASINYSLKEGGVAECFGENGCARCVSTVLIRAGYNPLLFNQCANYLIYESLIPMGARFIIDNNPDTRDTDLFVDPMNYKEIMKRIMPGDIIGFRGGSTESGQEYKSFQRHSHIGFVYSTKHIEQVYDVTAEIYMCAHNEEYEGWVGKGKAGTICVKSRCVSNVSFEKDGKIFKPFFDFPNPYVIRMPEIDSTWSSDITKKLRATNRQIKYSGSYIKRLSSFKPGTIPHNELIKNYVYDLFTLD